uniref:Uncharacterized protein n=1 Tax=Ditylum brightwellii TaxID=49249 RepID=A0A7S1ZEV9_9STRA|mmetsp:Transcript_3047/g.4638  ORF Transcript_3047/g.4638 Transcript_3047/m.4638 type:complete len:173 (+) Transcript_3047:103-621(+)
MRFYIAALLISSVAEGASVRGAHNLHLDKTCFIAAWNADNAEEACAAAKDHKGEPCLWCYTEGDAMGACLSSDEADMISQVPVIGEKMTCPDKAVEVSAAFSLPDMACVMVNIGDADADVCAGTNDDSGSPCTWCSYQDKGMCMGSAMADSAKEVVGDFGVTCGAEDLALID